jgi:hypothetical protein
MMKSLCGLSLLIIGLAPAWSSAQVTAGGEFLVVAYITTVPSRPSLALDGSGNFVVAWQSFQGDGDGFGVFAQRFGADGQRRGSEFRVNTYTTGWQLEPWIASDAAGRLVVTWSSHGQDGSDEGVFAQRYDASGAARGAEFQVNTATPSVQRDAVVASTPQGDFVVSWTSYNQDGAGNAIVARRYSAAGAPRGLEFVVNQSTAFDQIDSFVSLDAAGRFVVTWAHWFGDGSGNSVMARVHSASGAPGNQILVNTGWTNSQGDAVCASAASGDFVVAWMSETLDPGRGIAAQRFAASGARRGGEFRVNVYTTGNQTQPSIASDAAGNFVVTWTTVGEDGSGGGILGRRFDASGAPRGAPFQVNTYTTSHQSGARVVSDGVGNFVIVWEALDANPSGIRGQRFGGLFPALLTADTAAGPGSDGNRVVEPGESVDLQPSWRNVNGAAQTFNGVGLGFTGPAAAGVSYTLQDGAGLYGAVANGATGPCTDCYRVATTFDGTRPAVHWDATFTERLTPDVLGQTMPWPVHVGQSFTDMPRTSLYYRDVETILHRGVTGGCAAGLYCPGSVTTREQMAAFVLLAKEGAGYAPAACAPPNTFADVPETSIFCDVIEELARRGVVAGCGGGLYCPQAAVLREQMPVFVLRTLDPTLVPPDCGTPLFADVPASSPYCRWIEELARRGVVSGCGGGLYCPSAPVTREQMAVFVSGTFGLTLYGP